MNFYEALKKEQSKTKSLTTNGAVAYASTGKEILDFNFGISAFRHASETEIEKSFARVYYEDPLIAIKYLFYVSDIREGLGERKVFNACMHWLATNKPEIAKKVLFLIPAYSRWDYLVKLINAPTVTAEVRAIIAKQLETDISNVEAGKPISLLGKWLPSENASSHETKDLATTVRKALGLSSRNYRKTLSRLRKYMDVTEVKMSSKNWSEINYSAVPSQANMRYKDAFMRNDTERRLEYLESLKRGTTKINASVAGPSDIVYRYADYDETLEQMWKALPDVQLNDVLVVRDGSESMTWGGEGASKPINVATAMAIYAAQHNKGQWKNQFITFSSHPDIIDISSAKTLQDCLNITRCYNDCSNTDIYKTMKLILDTAKDNNMSQEDMPGTILIISDMQFDGYSMHFDESLFDSIGRMYRKAGYKFPKICFWNVDTVISKTIPIQQNEMGLILISGYSTSLMNMVMSGEIDPYKALMTEINKPRYDAVEEVVKPLLN